MRGKLREAAKKAGDTLPGDECLYVMIRRWEVGGSGISERYRLHYCQAFQIPVDRFGDPAAGPAARHGAPGPPEITAAEQLGVAVTRALCVYLTGGRAQPLQPVDGQRRGNEGPARQHRLWFLMGYVSCLLATAAKEHNDAS